MLKKIVILLSLIAVASAEAMDEPMEMEKTSSIVNSQADVKEFLAYLTALPTDVKGYIMQFLRFHDFEYEDEFVTRTKNTIKKHLPDHYYYKNFQKPALGQGGRGRMSIWTSSCPHEINVAVLNGNHLQIINVVDDSIIHTKEISPNNYTHVALAHNATMFATIRKTGLRDTFYRSADEKGHTLNTNLLTIYNIATQQTEEYELPPSFRIADANHCSTAFAFKKEGTHIILHGVNRSKIQNKKLFTDTPNVTEHHLIIPVTINKPYEGLNKQTLIYIANKIMAKTITDNPQ